MAIDWNACTGCGACVVACQAENNIAVVGKDQVRRGRDMQWLRVDSYYNGEPNDPDNLQPARSLHAVRNSAPCELVCPCSGHYPQLRRPQRYGVQPLRRYAVLFEQLPVQSTALEFLPVLRIPKHPGLKLLNNPDVTVRSRGVMEIVDPTRVQRINFRQNRT